MDGAGNLYGETVEGGQRLRCRGFGCGVVFELRRDKTRVTGWAETVLYRFCRQGAPCPDGGAPDGEIPGNGLLMDAWGNLYGTTSEGAGASGGGRDGVVFALSPNASRTAWTETVLHRFCTEANCADGRLPNPGLVMDAAGNLYGTTAAGGYMGSGYASNGVIFELTPNAEHSQWTETVLYRFCPEGFPCPDGAGPGSGVITDAAGNLYGTTGAGGASGNGVVFELTPNADRTRWTESVLHSFCPENGTCRGGALSAGALIMDAAGSLYGATVSGGTAHSAGVVFELTANAERTRWTETVLHSFCRQANCPDGDSPNGDLSMDAAGNLYGSTLLGGGAASTGVVYELTPNPAGTAWSETVLHRFLCGPNGTCPDGDAPVAWLSTGRETSTERPRSAASTRTVVSPSSWLNRRSRSGARPARRRWGCRSDSFAICARSEQRRSSNLCLATAENLLPASRSPKPT
jgi:uncharacterized repeat protein (TIGR03803 family)